MWNSVFETNLFRFHVVLSFPDVIVWNVRNVVGFLCSSHVEGVSHFRVGQSPGCASVMSVKKVCREQRKGVCVCLCECVCARARAHCMCMHLWRVCCNMWCDANFNAILIFWQLMVAGKAILGNRIFSWLMKRSFYGHFVAGEDLGAMRKAMKRLDACEIRTMFYVPVESDEGSESSEEERWAVRCNPEYVSSQKLTVNCQCLWLTPEALCIRKSTSQCANFAWLPCIAALADCHDVMFIDCTMKTRLSMPRTP